VEELSSLPGNHAASMGTLPLAIEEELRQKVLRKAI
jgi:hypothetical protein